MLDITKIIIIKRHIMSEKHSHIGYWRTDTCCWHHHTITVQGIRNDDQSLSPVTSLVSLLFLSFLIPRNVQEHFKFTSIINNLLAHACTCTHMCACIHKHTYAAHTHTHIYSLLADSTLALRRLHVAMLVTPSLHSGRHSPGPSNYHIHTDSPRTQR